MLCKAGSGWELWQGFTSTREQGGVEQSGEMFFYWSVMPHLEGVHTGQPLMCVELAGSLSLPSFLTPIFCIYPLFFSFFFFYSLFFLFSFSFSISLFYFSLEKQANTNPGTDGSYCKVITNLPHTWIVSYDTKSSVRCWCLLQSVIHRRRTKVLVQSPCFQPSYVPCSS